VCGFEITSYDFWVRSWKGYQLVLKLLLGPSYGVVISDILNEIQQGNIGQYNGVGYLLSLTASMRALLYEFPSSLDVFTINTSTTVYTPALMTKAQWIMVIQQLWLSFKDKLSYNRQQEYIHCRSKYAGVRHKPYFGKVLKVSSGPSARTPSPVGSRPTVTVTPTITKGKKDKSKPKSQKSPPTSRSSSPASSRGRKVEFGVAICISDLAKHYNIKSNLEPCTADCPYAHYNQLPSTLTTPSVLSKVKRIIGKLNLTDGQSQSFLSKIEEDILGCQSVQHVHPATMQHRKKKKK
jgi:hypothetical protein